LQLSYDLYMPSTAEDQALALLKSEVSRLNSLISLMESTTGKRGRTVMPVANSATKRGQRKWTAQQKKAASERTKARWAARKQAGQKKVAKGRKKAKKTAAA
jgi:hypothetical protein